MVIILIDGSKAMVHTEKAVKQGCPLIPILVALYVPDSPSVLSLLIIF